MRSCYNDTMAERSAIQHRRRSYLFMRRWFHEKCEVLSINYATDLEALMSGNVG